MGVILVNSIYVKTGPVVRRDLAFVVDLLCDHEVSGSRVHKRTVHVSRLETHYLEFCPNIGLVIAGEERFSPQKFNLIFNVAWNLGCSFPL
jgi:hypothetical protein